MKRESAFLMVFLMILVTSLFSLGVQRVEASGTVYIRADGSIDPPTSPISTVDNVTYILTGNITSDADGIVIERDNIVVEGADYAVQGKGAHDSDGIDLSGRENVTVLNTRILAYGYGISAGSSNSSIIGNNIIDNSNGIFLGGYSNIIAGNNITNNSFDGILLMGSNNNITGNNITKNGRYGIWLWSGSGHSMNGNDITANYDAGVMLDSSGNKFYHNNFNNTRQLKDPSWESSLFEPRLNVWDDGYPSGGNYWSNYNGADTNHDGIGDTPYIIDTNNTDHYPLMVQYVIPEFPSFLVLPLFFIATLLAVVVCKRKHAKRE